MFELQMIVAGLWPQLWHWGTGIGVIIICIACAWFTTAVPVIGPYLKGIRKDLVWVAVAVAVFLAGNVMGARDQASKDKAKGAVVTKHVDKVVKSVKTPKFKSTKDPWDNPNY